MTLPPLDFAPFIEFRRRLHRSPELSGAERETASSVASFLAGAQPDALISGIGGHGLAAVFEGKAPGPAVMLRAELDALPIEEESDVLYRSSVPGVAHLCGHDGHATILTAVAFMISRHRPHRGRAILLFQPAEETGEGAAAMLADPQFAAIAPDYAFALHNMPKLPFGTAAISPGIANCASRGSRIVLKGRTAHASEPHTGLSPAGALAELMPAFASLSRGDRLDDSFRLATVTHARLGEPAFGISPGMAELWVTLRTLRNEAMSTLAAEAEALARSSATRHRLEVEMEYRDVFPHCENHPEAVQILKEVFGAETIPYREAEPMRGSEDFGRFGQTAKSAMFLLGSGDEISELHHPTYDFPDALIETGARIFFRLLRRMLYD